LVLDAEINSAWHFIIRHDIFPYPSPWTSWPPRHKRAYGLSTSKT